MCSRKYRQSGYMDDDRQDRRPGQGRPGARGPRSQPDGPRGRGLGAPTQTVFRCARCGHKQALPEPLTSESVCRDCGGDLHTCTHCSSFDTSALNECIQVLSEAVASKAKRNECTLFTPRGAQEFGTTKTRDPDDPKSAFDALFDS